MRLQISFLSRPTTEECLQLFLAGERLQNLSLSLREKACGEFGNLNTRTNALQIHPDSFMQRKAKQRQSARVRYAERPRSRVHLVREAWFSVIVIGKTQILRL